MLGLLLIAAAGATSLLLAATVRLPSLVSTLLVAYLAFVANLGVTTLVLSLFHAVTRGGLAIAEGVLLAVALVCWQARGRPGLPLVAARAAVRVAGSDPVTVLFLVVAVALLAYELLLGSAPINNMDSLTYHLSRAAAWRQHNGIYWIPDAPEVELNAYQPLAEQQILFLFTATGTSAVYFIPQYLAELVILVAVYGGARRLGFEVRASVGAVCLLATFSVVALESFTAQNDLVAASFAAVGACLLLSGGPLEAAFAGTAAAFGLGTKLTGGLVLPILAALALVRGRRIVAAALAGGIAGAVGLAMWGYVLNHEHTGHLLGVGTSGVQNRSSPSYPGSVANAFYLMYGLMDASILSSRLIHLLAVAGLVAGVAVAAWAIRRGSTKRAVADGFGVATPFLAPVLVIGGAAVVSYIAGVWGFPIRGEGGLLGPLTANLNMEYGRIANEDYSAYGPVGIVALLVASGLTLYMYARRRVDARHLVLALALPAVLVFIALTSYWVPFLIRYFLLPAAIAAPLLACLLWNRVVTAAFLVVAAISIGLTITHDQPKPLNSPYGLGRPWNQTWGQALTTNSRSDTASQLAAYEQLVPSHACVGALLGPNEPAFLLYGRKLQHRVVYLPGNDTVTSALRHGLFYVVIGSDYPDAPDAFAAAGWRVRKLGEAWMLASERARPGAAGAADACTD